MSWTRLSDLLMVVLTLIFFVTSILISGSDGKVSAYYVGDPASIPGLGRSPGEGNGNPLQYPCLENPTDRGAWYATVCGVTKSRTRLSDFTFSLSLFILVVPIYIPTSSHLFFSTSLPTHYLLSLL